MVAAACNEMDAERGERVGESARASRAPWLLAMVKERDYSMAQRRSERKDVGVMASKAVGW